MRTYTQGQNKTKQSKRTQECGSNSEVLIRPSNSDVSAQLWKDLVEEESCEIFIIVWCLCMCVRVYVSVCVCCVCVTCTYSGVDMYPSIRTYIYSFKRSCMWMSRISWYVTNMFQTRTNMNKPTLWERGGKGGKQKKFSSAYQLANIQKKLYWLRYLNFHRPWMMDSRFLGGKQLKTRNDDRFDMTFSHFLWGLWQICDAKLQRFGSKSNPYWQATFLL